MSARRQLRVWGFMLVAVLGAWAIASLPELFFTAPSRPGEIPHTRIVAVTVAVLFAVVWAYAFAKRALRNADEFFRAAEKVSWYWGGTAGLLASVPIFAFIALGGLHWIDPAGFGVGRELFWAFAMGYLLPTFMQFAGFLAARAWWQISKR